MATLRAGMALLVVGAGMPGCATDAVGVDACRDIEEARCEAAEPCGMIDDVGACKRFYRDQCLHGLVAEEQPGRTKLAACVDVLRAAGQCRKQGIETIADCTSEGITESTTLTQVCDIVTRPEETEECRFLIPETPPLPEPDSGPDAGSEASSDAAAG
jgi:hypothetical protein